MNKSQLVDQIALSADISKTKAEKALKAVMESVSHALSNGNEVALVGFGTFRVNERAERKGRNPKTGEEITIAAAKVPTFKGGTKLKAECNA